MNTGAAKLIAGWKEIIMKAIMVMYDSLNRHLLRPYGCQWTEQKISHAWRTFL